MFTDLWDAILNLNQNVEYLNVNVVFDASLILKANRKPDSLTVVSKLCTPQRVNYSHFQ